MDGLKYSDDDESYSDPSESASNFSSASDSTSESESDPENRQQSNRNRGGVVVNFSPHFNLGDLIKTAKKSKRHHD